MKEICKAYHKRAELAWTMVQEKIQLGKRSTTTQELWVKCSNVANVTAGIYDLARIRIYQIVFTFGFTKRRNQRVFGYVENDSHLKITPRVPVNGIGVADWREECNFEF